MLSYPYYGYGGATIGSGSYYGHDFNTMGRVPTLYQNLINSYNTYYGMDAYRQPTVSFPAAPFPPSPSLGYTRGSFSPYSQVPRNFYQERSRNLYQETFRNLYQERLRNLYQEGFSANPGRANKRPRTSGIWISGSLVQVWWGYSLNYGFLFSPSVHAVAAGTSKLCNKLPDQFKCF